MAREVTDYPNPTVIVEVEIASGQTVSEVGYANGLCLARVNLPAAWTSGDITLQVSDEEGGASGFGDLKDADGNAPTITTAAAGERRNVEAADYQFINHFKFECSVAQAADRTVQFVFVRL